MAQQAVCGVARAAACRNPAYTGAFQTRSSKQPHPQKQQPLRQLAAPWCPSQQQGSGGGAGHRRPRRQLPPCSAGMFGGLFGGSSSSSASEEQQQQVAAAGAFEGDDDEDGDEEGSKMLQLDEASSGSLDGSSEEPLGPLALLAVGFTQQEFQLLRRLLHEDMQAEMVKIVPASGAAMAGSLGAALEADPVPAFEQAPLGTRRVCFLSGMYASEVMETMAAYREAGLPDAVFAAAVPNNYGRSLNELVQEVFADHQAMKRKRQQQQLEQQQAQQ